ncbi:Uncharacterised protein [Actinobacillus equuli]|nr:Uncharacterised protein [Actinobacillus equuli]
MALNRELRIKALVTNEAAYGAKIKLHYLAQVSLATQIQSCLKSLTMLLKRCVWQAVKV